MTGSAGLAPTLRPLRAAGPLALVVLGSGVLLTEVGHALLDVAAIPEPVALFFERYNRGEPVAVVLAVLVAPIAEEGLFRGLLLRSLLPFGERTALVASAAAFSVCHLSIVRGLAALWLGLLFGWAYLRTGSLALCVAGHALWNAQWWIAGLLGHPVAGYSLVDLGGPFPRQPVWWIAAGVMAFGAGLGGLRGRPKLARPRSRSG